MLPERAQLAVLLAHLHPRAGRKNRQPLSKMYVKSGTKLNDDCITIIREELNIREVVFTDDAGEFISYSFKPQLKTIGPKYGKMLGEIREALNTADGSKTMAELKSNGYITLNLSGGEIRLYEGSKLIGTGFFVG